MELEQTSGYHIEWKEHHKIALLLYLPDFCTFRGMFGPAEKALLLVMTHRSNSVATPSLCMFFWQQCFPACTVNYCFSFFSYEINLSSTKWTSSYRKSLHPCTFSIKKEIIAPYFLLPAKSLWLIPPCTKKNYYMTTCCQLSLCKCTFYFLILLLYVENMETQVWLLSAALVVPGRISFQGRAPPVVGG